MSDNKKVIRVKDLVIEAENVIIESKKRPVRDPFFGGFGPRAESSERMESSSRSSSSELLGESDDRKDDRRPFSWI